MRGLLQVASNRHAAPGFLLKYLEPVVAVVFQADRSEQDRLESYWATRIGQASPIAFVVLSS